MLQVRHVLTSLLLVSLMAPVSALAGGKGKGGGAPRPSDSDCCRPRSKGFWHRQCLGLGEITPGRGSGGGPGIHPAFTEDELRRIVARATRRAGTRCGSICEALDEANHRTPRGRARAEYAALLLNAEAGFLRGCDRGEGEIRRCEGHFDAGRFDDAHRCAGDVNECRSVRRCGGDHDDEDSDHEDSDHEDSDHEDSDHDKSHGKGHDKKKCK
jgi:hypothetical protein